MTCFRKDVSMLLQILTSLRVFRMECPCFHAHGYHLGSVKRKTQSGARQWPK